jgi:FAD:protein FMN transferase
MGTVVTIDLFGEPSVEKVSHLVESACDVLHEVDDVFSTWRSDSPISRLRRGELPAEALPAAVGEVLRHCEDARTRSSGWFDPWAMPGGVDPTGYVKGWAAQLALSRLQAPGVRGAIVNAAGDIATSGGPGPGASFRVGIADPFSPSRLACVVELDGAIATSGTYERGAHLVDPHSGKPAAAVASASVCGPDLGLADALATAVAVCGSVGLLDALPGYEGLVMGFDRRWSWTARFPFVAPA